MSVEILSVLSSFQPPKHCIASKVKFADLFVSKRSLILRQQRELHISFVLCTVAVLTDSEALPTRPGNSWNTLCYKTKSDYRCRNKYFLESTSTKMLLHWLENHPPNLRNPGTIRGITNSLRLLNIKRILFKWKVFYRQRNDRAYWVAHMKNVRLSLLLGKAFNLTSSIWKSMSQFVFWETKVCDGKHKPSSCFRCYKIGHSNVRSCT